MPAMLSQSMFCGNSVAGLSLYQIRVAHGVLKVEHIQPWVSVQPGLGFRCFAGNIPLSLCVFGMRGQDRVCSVPKG